MHTNPELQLARQFIEQTGENLFLTGKAGTGKTTFLRQLRETTNKRMIVVAPTGIAAMNAGGVTIHSFFQLSFAPFIPDTKFVSSQKNYFKFSKEKKNIIKSLNLLVIDEVSMVRADLLDAVDDVLRRYRDRDKPFGGVQLLMIGDMQQLAPVVKDDEQQLLRNYYDTNYFFSSHALAKTTYLTIELKQVYRQQDMHFLGLLNKIRTNQADEYTIGELNKRYIPNFRPRQGEGYITLTTHNYQAQRINDQRLNELPGQLFAFQAHITGEFPEYLYPIDKTLSLKQGAQIMFVKNDSSGAGRYFNGKIGRVTRIDSRHIEVLGEGDEHSIILEAETWQNNQYTLNDETKEIVEKELGTFKHFPIKLAWAITIHKSQGLTFERAIINANMSFAHGQVYVALSRCKTLEGMVLSAPLDARLLISDEVLTQFAEQVENGCPKREELLLASQRYYLDLLKELFDFRTIESPLKRFTRLLDEYLYTTYPTLLEKYKTAIQLFDGEVVKVSDKFCAQYSALFMKGVVHGSDASKLQERIVAGASYFHKKIEAGVAQLVASTHPETDNKEIKKRSDELLDELSTALRLKLYVLKASSVSFSISEYLAAKAKASIEDTTAKVKEKKVRAQKATKVEVSDDMQHPGLYKLLKAWRDEEAKRIGQPVYIIIQQKAMLGISNLLPMSKSDLARVPYFGKKGAEKYGDVILDIVKGYLERGEFH